MRKDYQPKYIALSIIGAFTIALTVSAYSVWPSGLMSFSCTKTKCDPLAIWLMNSRFDATKNIGAMIILSVAGKADKNKPEAARAWYEYARHSEKDSIFLNLMREGFKQNPGLTAPREDREIVEWIYSVAASLDSSEAIEWQKKNNLR